MRGQKVRIRGATGGGGSGARANGSNGTDPTGAGGSWVVDYTGEEGGASIGPTYNEWDDDERVEFDGTDEMVVSEDGIYLVVAETNQGYADGTSGYYSIDLTKNGDVIASYAQSALNAWSFGYIDMPTVRWVGVAEAGDRFALAAHNQTDSDLYFGWYHNFIYCAYLAPWTPA